MYRTIRPLYEKICPPPDVKAYVAEKERMLRKEFKIYLNDYDCEKLHNCTTMHSVDYECRKILKTHLS